MCGMQHILVDVWGGLCALNEPTTSAHGMPQRQEEGKKYVDTLLEYLHSRRVLLASGVYAPTYR